MLVAPVDTPGRPGAAALVVVPAGAGLGLVCLASSAWRACSASIDGVATKYCQRNSTAADSAMARRTFF